MVSKNGSVSYSKTAGNVRPNSRLFSHHALMEIAFPTSRHYPFIFRCPGQLLYRPCVSLYHYPIGATHQFLGHCRCCCHLLLVPPCALPCHSIHRHFYLHRRYGHSPWQRPYHGLHKFWAHLSGEPSEGRPVRAPGRHFLRFEQRGRGVLGFKAPAV